MVKLDLGSSYTGAVVDHLETWTQPTPHPTLSQKLFPTQVAAACILGCTAASEAFVEALKLLAQSVPAAIKLGLESAGVSVGEQLPDTEALSLRAERCRALAVIALQSPRKRFEKVIDLYDSIGFTRAQQALASVIKGKVSTLGETLKQHSRSIVLLSLAAVAMGGAGYYVYQNGVPDLLSYFRAKKDPEMCSRVDWQTELLPLKPTPRPIPDKPFVFKPWREWNFELPQPSLYGMWCCVVVLIKVGATLEYFHKDREDIEEQEAKVRIDAYFKARPDAGFEDVGNEEAKARLDADFKKKGA